MNATEFTSEIREGIKAVDERIAHWEQQAADAQKTLQALRIDRQERQDWLTETLTQMVDDAKEGAKHPF